jgi:hypothetical protein
MDGMPVRQHRALSFARWGAMGRHSQKLIAIGKTEMIDDVDQDQGD